MEVDSPISNIILTGGGTGGHITPILALAHELKTQNPNVHIIYVGEKNGKFAELTQNNADIDQVFTIHAGKFRRYYGQSLLKTVLDIKTMTQNVIDIFKFVIGILEAWIIIYKTKPSVIFQKGGFVGVPVGIAAAHWRIPIVTHDSDAQPGLANKMVSRWAKIHATALSAENYSYPIDKVVQIGVLVEHNYQKVSGDIQHSFKKDLKISEFNKILLITGGSSGAERINEAIKSIVDELLKMHSNLLVIHQVGKGKSGVYKGYKHDRLKVLEFLTPMYKYMGAADLIVCRASANTLAELGVQGKACIVIPSKYLAGGHQIKNAKILEEQGAVMVINEENMLDPQVGILRSVDQLLVDETKRQQLASTLQMNTITDAPKRLAKILLNQIKKK